MTSENVQDPIDELSKLLLDTITLAQPPEIPARFASVETLHALRSDLMALREFLYATANGDLSTPVNFKGYVAGTLKTLQANLRHITWQTKMVASGDFSQRAEFIGEFSHSFNSMVVQLEQTLNELVRKEKELSEANEVLRESEERLRLLAISDSLTGLNNRRHFFELAEAEVGRSLRYSRPLAVMMFDIDFFKHVNDTYGHVAGDAVLKMVAGATRETIRASDIAGRYGGEEFVVLLPETAVKVAAAAAERLRKRIEAATVREAGRAIKVTASFGVSDDLGGPDSQPPERLLLQLIDKADRALYVSKNSGRNKVTVSQSI